MALIKAAYHYLDNGLNPIPVNSDKSPRLQVGHPYLYQKIDDIDKRFIGVPLVGIAGGRISDGLECLDFDKSHGSESIDVIFNDYIYDPQVKYLLSEGKLSVNKTMNGGYHIIFRSEFANGSTVLARHYDKSVMIETRGEGAYFVVPPSPGYELIKGVELIKLQQLEKEEREYLFNFARFFSKSKQDNKPGDKKIWPESWDNSKPFGRFNNEGWPYAEKALLQAGWQRLESRRTDGAVYWLRPGKEKGTSATYGHRNGMFYVFTSNAEPFETQTAYTASDVMIKLKFSNDATEFKEWLHDLYKIKPVIIQKAESSKPEFPLNVFHESIESFLSICNQANDYNKDFLAVSALYTFASICGNSYKLKVKNGWIAPSIFWFVAVGDTGTMKTHPLKYVTKPITKLDMISKKQYDEETKEWVLNEKKGQKPSFRQIQVNDYTLEALHDVCLYNKRGVGMFRDEIVGFLKDMNKYRKGSDEEFWLESYNNGSYIVNRVTKDVIAIENICINILGSIQPDVLAGIAKEREGNGLIERFLFTVSEENIHHLKDAEIPKEWEDWWDATIMQFNSYCQPIEGKATIIDISPECFKRLQKYDIDYTKIQTSENETSGIKNYVSKIKTYMPRFMLILSVIDGFMDGTLPEVTPAHVDRANLICNYFIESAKTIFTDADNKNEIKSVAENLRGKTKTEIITALVEKGFKQKDVAKYVKSPPSYVSRVMKEWNDKKPNIEK